MHVASHYNARKQQNPDERKDSPIFRLRLFNNWIKAMLIQKALRHITTKQPHVRVLDLACGKGGDLTKYKRSEFVKFYVGVDIAEVSVEHARERYSSGRFPFKAEFYSGDAFGNPLEKIIPSKPMVHLVSCQFALHYAFKSEQICRRALENISESLLHDGVFICTVPNKQVICDRVDQDVAHNAHYCIKFTNNDTTDDDKYGREYTFWLSDAIDNCPEYLIDKDNFVGLCRGYGLVLMECMNFKDVYVRQGPEYMDLLKNMGVIEDGRLQMSRDEMTIAELYDLYMFSKK